MKIALVQINPIIGDFKYNCRKISDWVKTAARKDCRLVIFPELVISGYPPQDLLERNDFLEAHDLALDDLVSEFPAGIDVIVGCIVRRSSDHGKNLFNGLKVFRDGKCIAEAHKRLLPTYDVFDETRYFEPGEMPPLYDVDGVTFGLTICEDVWSDEVHDYDVEPVAELFTAAKGAGNKIDAVINISASPFQAHKEEVRKSIFRRLAATHKVPFLYCNQVGGQDSLIFDGRSFVIDAAGNVSAQSCGFTENMVIVDTHSWQGGKNESTELPVEEAVYRALTLGVRDYVGKCGFKSVVLGLSGGIDSALTAAIAVEALGAENVMGVALPSQYSSDASLEDARELAENLNCRFEILPIEGLFAGFRENLSTLFAGLEEDLTEQNLQARIRGNLLMALSNKFGHLLLTTGNKSEMAVGYCTLYGDMSGGLAVISDVPKQMVYQLSRYVNREREIIPESILTKAPSAELKPDQTDQDDLPPYGVLDEILELHLEKGKGIKYIVEAGYDEPVVRDILRRVKINEYKRKQAPMGLKVTSKAFGYGRRYPNVQNYAG